FPYTTLFRSGHRRHPLNAQADRHNFFASADMEDARVGLSISRDAPDAVVGSVVRNTLISRPDSPGQRRDRGARPMVEVASQAAGITVRTVISTTEPARAAVTATSNTGSGTPRKPCPAPRSAGSTASSPIARAVEMMNAASSATIPIT